MNLFNRQAIFFIMSIKKSPLAQQLQAKGVLLPKCLVFTLKRIKDPEIDPTRQCLLPLWINRTKWFIIISAGSVNLQSAIPPFSYATRTKDEFKIRYNYKWFFEGEKFGNCYKDPRNSKGQRWIEDIYPSDKEELLSRKRIYITWILVNVFVFI